MSSRRTPLSHRAIALLIGVLALSPAHGDDSPDLRILGEGKAAKARLDEARKCVEERKWAESIEQLQALLNSAGNDLIAVNSTFSIRAGRLCQVQLAALPPEGLRLYRQRYEGQARRSLEQARSERDGPALRRLVEEKFCTRAAEKAIDLLGDLAFERGRFDEAEEWWRLLAPLPDARQAAAPRGFALVYPDLTLDPARIQAKQLLAHLFAGRADEWTAELEAYRTQHGKAEGQLAGRKGRYADALAALADERKKSPPAEPLDWPTFGGAPSRGRVIPAPADILDRLSALCREGPTWSFDLIDRQADPVPDSALSAKQARSLAFHPIIVGEQVVTADARHVIAHNLRSGRSRKLYDVGKDNRIDRLNLDLLALPDLRYTLTADEGPIYARLGSQDIGPEAPAEAPAFGKPGKPRRENETFLACLDPQFDDPKVLRWQVRGKLHDNALFEGAPLVADGQIWIASTRYGNSRCTTAIECYGAGDPTGPPLRWRRDVCEDNRAGEPRYRHHLLTLAGTQIVYCTHSGAIVAVDALTGRTNWAVRYPSGEANQDADRDRAKVALKDLAPVLSAAGRLYVAPEDSDCLLCLDPATGKTLWLREDMKVVHLLGVGQGRLIFTTTGGLRAVGAEDGEDSSGWRIPHAGGDLIPAGRGLLIGDLVLWPTVRHGDFSEHATVYAVRQRDGMPAGDPSMLHRLPAGNLAYANGCLVVADLRTLSVFVPPRLLLPRRRAEVRRHPDSAPALLQRGRAEADADRTEHAMETLHQAEAKAGNLTGSQRKHLLHEARSERQRVLLQTAQRAARAEQWQEAETAARQAVAVPLSARSRLHALLRTAQMWKDAGQPERARAVWDTIRADAELRPIQVIDRQGRPLSVGEAASSDRPAANDPGHKPKAEKRRPVAENRLPLLRSWHSTLSAEEWVLDGWQDSDPELLLTAASRGQLLCRSSANGEVRWQHSLPFAPRWASTHSTLIVAAGAGGIAGLHRDSGDLLWHFPAPAAGHTPTPLRDDVSVVVDPTTPEPLTDFRLVSGRLFFLQGQRRLFALDAAAGTVLWHRWAPDGGFRFPFPQSCFSSCYHAGAETVLIQSARQRWLFDAANGKVIQQAADSRDLWQRSPLPLNEHALCLVPDSRHIELVDVRSGQVRWTHTLAGGSTLSGEHPQVLGQGNVLLFVKPANIGYFLQRLDPTTGKPIWANPVLLAARTVNLNTWAFDQEAVYCLEDASLIARSLADGKTMWRQSLERPDGWQVRREGDALMIWPRPSAEDARLWFRSPLGALQWNLGPLLMPESVFTLAYRDPKTGQLVQRLNFRIDMPARTTGPDRTKQGEGGRFLVVRTSSFLASAEGPVVRLDSPQPLIVAGRSTWGLSAADADKSEPRP